MSQSRDFAKLHGLGNDFVLLDRRGDGSDARPPPIDEAVRLCDRHRGIGADGVLTLLPSRDGDARLVIHNSDGSVPEMCGNGARCAALWIATGGGQRPARGIVRLETDAGPRPCVVSAQRGNFGEVEIEMGMPEIGPTRALVIEGREAPALPVSMGNPHRVVLLDEGGLRLRDVALRDGPGLSRSENANIELVARTGPLRYETVVYERGAGLTQACGTGACAVAAAAVFRGEAKRGEEIRVDLPGGALYLRWDAGGQMRMRGPAELVYRGTLP
jgi:diaminopimelate epimerase